MTTTRRDVLKASAALVSVAAASLPLRAEAAEALRYCKVAYDGCFAAAGLFAQRARELGADVFDIQGDITALWYEYLQPHWKAAPAAVAGLTRYNCLLALQMMASIHGLRVVYRAHHVYGSALARHAVYGPHAALAAGPALRGEPAQWAPVAAEVLMGWHADWIAIDRRRSTILQAGERGVPAGALISWILAPVRPAAV